MDGLGSEDDKANIQHVSPNKLKMPTDTQRSMFRKKLRPDDDYMFNDDEASKIKNIINRKD